MATPMRRLPMLRIVGCELASEGRPTSASGSKAALMARRPIYPPEADSSRTSWALPKWAQQATSLDHLIGAAEQHRWHFQAERFRGLEIDDQREFGWLVKRDISRISALKNSID